MAVVELGKCLVILMILYAFILVFALMAMIPMILHVYPRSECLLFSSQSGNKLFYGHYASKLTRCSQKTSCSPTTRKYVGSLDRQQQRI